MEKVQEFTNSIVYEDEDGNSNIVPKSMEYIFKFINTENKKKTFECKKYNKEFKVKYVDDINRYLINSDNIGFLKPYDKNTFRKNLKKSIKTENGDHVLENIFRKRLILIVGNSMFEDNIEHEEDGWIINDVLKLTYDRRMLVWRNPVRQETAFNTYIDTDFGRSIDIKINGKDVSLYPKEYKFLIKYMKLRNIEKTDILETDETYWSTIENCMQEMENGSLKLE